MELSKEELLSQREEMIKMLKIASRRLRAIATVANHLPRREAAQVQAALEGYSDIDHLVEYAQKAPIHGAYVTLSFDLQGNIVLTGTRAARGESRFFRSQSSASALESLLEDILSNSAWEILRPEEVGALTDAPILGEEVERDEDGKLLRCKAVYWFPDYMVRDEIRAILQGSVTFERAEEWE